MDHPKIGASRHNTRTAPKITPSVGSTTPASPSLIVVDGNPDKETKKSKFLEPTTTIKRSQDFCSNRSCGSPWTVHHHPVALKMHIKSWFDYGKYGSVVNTYGPDVCNEVIQEYKKRWAAYKRNGKEIESPGAVFHTTLQDVLAGGEPRNDPQDVRDAWSDVTMDRDKKRPAENHENQCLPCGCIGWHQAGCRHYQGVK